MSGTSTAGRRDGSRVELQRAGPTNNRLPSVTRALRVSLLWSTRCSRARCGFGLRRGQHSRTVGISALVSFFDRLWLSAPLFAVVLVGAAIAHWTPWPRVWTRRLNQFVFAMPLPVLLFRAVSRVGGETQTDPKLLAAFFGSCALVFTGGWFLARRVLLVAGVDAAVVGVASVFSNNGMLGVPLVQALLGPEAMPAVAWIMTFNAVTLWTLVTLVVEISREGPVAWGSLARTLIRVASTPIVFGIALGVMVAVSGISVPEPVGQTFDLISACAGPLALVALGLDVAHYDVRRGARAAGLICGLKLLVQPFVAWGLCRGMNLPRLETEVVVLMASLAVGVNVHLMAQRFKAQEAAVASALVSSTLLGIVTTPLVVSLLGG